MKVFISADIEGVMGASFKEECRKGNPDYEAMAQQMTLEVLAACRGAQKAGARDIVIKDGHGGANNIDVFQMPAGVRLIRGKSGHPYNMMYGLDESFDAVIFIGYHSGTGNPGSPLSHTSTGVSNYIRLNGQYTTEFLINSYIAASLGVPVVFLSGEDAICQEAKNIIPAINTVASKACVGGATINRSREEVLALIEEGVQEALGENLSKYHLDFPRKFEEVISFKDHTRAFKMSFYPGMEKIDDHTLKFVTDDYLELLTANSFVLY